MIDTLWKLAMGTMLLAAVCIAGSLMISVVSVAQDTTAATGGGTEVDLTPLTTPLLEFAGVVLSVILTWGIRQMSKKFNLSIDADQLKLVDQVANKAVNFARQQLAGEDGKVTVHIKNEVVATAADYLISSVPDALKHFKIDPVQNRERIEKLIEARLPVYGSPGSQASLAPAAAE